MDPRKWFNGCNLREVEDRLDWTENQNRLAAQVQGVQWKYLAYSLSGLLLLLAAVLSIIHYTR